MAYKYREEIVGKRFLSVRNPGKLKVSKISEWEWRSGVVRAVSGRDTTSPDLSVLIEFDDIDWQRREWVRVFDIFQEFLVEHTLVWAARAEPEKSKHQVSWPALSFRAIVDKAGLGNSKRKPLEFLVDRFLALGDEKDISFYQEGDEDRHRTALDYPEARQAIKNWVDYQDGQRILLTTPTVLVGYRIEVYRAEGTTQWYTAVIHSYNHTTKALAVTDDTVLEEHNEDPALIQMHLIDDGVVDSILRGVEVGIVHRRRQRQTNKDKEQQQTLTTSSVSAHRHRSQSPSLSVSGGRSSSRKPPRQRHTSGSSLASSVDTTEKGSEKSNARKRSQPPKEKPEKSSESSRGNSPATSGKRAKTESNSSSSTKTRGNSRENVIKTDTEGGKFDRRSAKTETETKPVKARSRQSRERARAAVKESVGAAKEPVSTTKERVNTSKERVNTKESVSTPKERRERVSTSKERVSRSTERVNSTKEHNLSSKERVSLTEKRVSSSKDRVSASKERVSSAKERVNSSKECVSSSKERGSASKERVNTPKEQINTPKERVSTTKERVSTPKERVSTHKERVSTPKEHVNTPKEGLSSSKESVISPKESVNTVKESLSTSKEPLKISKESAVSPKESVGTLKENVTALKEDCTTKGVSSTKESICTSKEHICSTKESAINTNKDSANRNCKNSSESSNVTVEQEPESSKRPLSATSNSKNKGKSLESKPDKKLPKSDKSKIEVAKPHVEAQQDVSKVNTEKIKVVPGKELPSAENSKSCKDGGVTPDKQNKELESEQVQSEDNMHYRKQLLLAGGNNLNKPPRSSPSLAESRIDVNHSVTDQIARAEKIASSLPLSGLGADKSDARREEKVRELLARGNTTCSKPVSSNSNTLPSSSATITSSDDRSDSNSRTSYDEHSNSGFTDDRRPSSRLDDLRGNSNAKNSPASSPLIIDKTEPVYPYRDPELMRKNPVQSNVQGMLPKSYPTIHTPVPAPPQGASMTTTTTISSHPLLSRAALAYPPHVSVSSLPTPLAIPPGIGQHLEALAQQRMAANYGQYLSMSYPPPGNVSNLELLWQQKYPTIPVPSPWMLLKHQEDLIRDVSSIYREREHLERERERIERERIERLDRDRLEREVIERRLERERQEKEKERDRLEKEKAERERAERERAERLEKEKQDRERQERREQERLQERNRHEREQRQERERILKESADTVAAVNQHFTESLRLAAERGMAWPSRSITLGTGKGSMIAKPEAQAIEALHAGYTHRVSPVGKHVVDQKPEVNMEANIKQERDQELREQEYRIANEAVWRHQEFLHRQREEKQTLARHQEEILKQHQLIQKAQQKQLSQQYKMEQNDSHSKQAEPDTKPPPAHSFYPYKNTSYPPVTSGSSHANIKQEPNFNIYGYQPFQQYYISRDQLHSYGLAPEKHKIDSKTGLPPSPKKQEMSVPPPLIKDGKPHNSVIVDNRSKEHSKSGSPHHGRYGSPVPSSSPRPQPKPAHTPERHPDRPLSSSSSPAASRHISPTAATANSIPHAHMKAADTRHHGLPRSQSPLHVASPHQLSAAVMQPMDYRSNKVRTSPASSSPNTTANTTMGSSGSHTSVAVSGGYMPAIAEPPVSLPRSSVNFSYSLIQQGLVPNPIYTQNSKPTKAGDLQGSRPVAGPVTPSSASVHKSSAGSAHTSPSMTTQSMGASQHVVAGMKRKINKESGNRKRQRAEAAAPPSSSANMSIPVTTPQILTNPSPYTTTSSTTVSRSATSNSSTAATTTTMVSASPSSTTASSFISQSKGLGFTGFMDSFKSFVENTVQNAFFQDPELSRQKPKPAQPQPQSQQHQSPQQQQHQSPHHQQQSPHHQQQSPHQQQQSPHQQQQSTHQQSPHQQQQSPHQQQQSSRQQQQSPHLQQQSPHLQQQSPYQHQQPSQNKQQHTELPQHPHKQQEQKPKSNMDNCPSSVPLLMTVPSTTDEGSNLTNLSNSSASSCTLSILETINRVANGQVDTDSDTLSAPSPPPQMQSCDSSQSSHRSANHPKLKKAWLQRHSDEDREKEESKNCQASQGDNSQQKDILRNCYVNCSYISPSKEGGTRSPISALMLPNGNIKDLRKDDESTSSASEVESQDKYALYDHSVQPAWPVSANVENSLNADSSTAKKRVKTKKSHSSNNKKMKTESDDGAAPVRKKKRTKEPKDGQKLVKGAETSSDEGLKKENYDDGSSCNDDKKCDEKDIKKIEENNNSSKTSSNSGTTSAMDTTGTNSERIKEEQEEEEEEGKKEVQELGQNHPTSSSESSEKSSESSKERRRQNRKKKQQQQGSENKSGASFNRPLVKASITTLKRTCEMFLQDGACADVTPKLMKCRECKMTPTQRSKKLPNIFCRFYAFRRLRYSQKGFLTIAGFSELSDAEPVDVDPWTSHAPIIDPQLDLETAKFIVARVGDKFCELVEQEKEARIFAGEEAKIAWKRAVTGVREMCDVCDTTLFNMHWVCHKCGFVVCIDCYKVRLKNIEAEVNEQQDEIPMFKEEQEWLTCSSNRQPHEVDKLMLTQIIPRDALWDLGRLIHDMRAKWGLPAKCPCGHGYEKEKYLQQKNGISQHLVKKAINHLSPEKSKKLVNGIGEDHGKHNKGSKKHHVSPTSVNGNVKSAKLTGYNPDTSSPLSLLADVASMDSESNGSRDRSESPYSKRKAGEMDKLGKSYKPITEPVSPCQDGEGEKKNAASCSTLRELLTKTAGKVKTSEGSKKSKIKNVSSSTLDDIIQSVVEKQLPRDGENAPMKLMHYVPRYVTHSMTREAPILVHNLTETSVLYPDVPHSWLSDGRLLRLHDPRHKGNLKIFQEQWRRGQPVLVSGCDKFANRELWIPKAFESFGNIENDLVNCRTSNVIVSHKMKDFWDGFEVWEERLLDEEEDPMLLKLKDWPPGDDLSDILPRHFEDLMKVLPLPEYTSRQGKLNLASRLPDFLVRPDLGPKMYNAYGSASFPKEGTTNLHLDVSDAVNVMMYVGIPADGPGGRTAMEQAALKAIDDAGCDMITKRRVREVQEVPGALWHIYDAHDADKIRDFLNKVGKELGEEVEPHHDPIHDQSWYIHEELQIRLLREYGVQGYTIVQCMGDAIFIPAGAPHQVRNLHSCIKMAEDFVSPEHLNHCFQMTQEFRLLSDTHSNHEDKLQVKNIIYHAVKDAVAVLNDLDPDSD